MIKAVLFDFGGVLANEGFKEGLFAIAQKNNLSYEPFLLCAADTVVKTGYLLGECDEAAFWKAARSACGFSGTDEELRNEILSRFVLRPQMLEFAASLKASGFVIGILSDQTNWLEELNQEHHFYDHFDYVFNSYRLKMCKREPHIFSAVCNMMGLKFSDVFFIDDTLDNVQRAAQLGLMAFHFKSINDLPEIQRLLKGIE